MPDGMTEYFRSALQTQNRQNILIELSGEHRGDGSILTPLPSCALRRNSLLFLASLQTGNRERCSAPKNTPYGFAAAVAVLRQGGPPEAYQDIPEQHFLPLELPETESRQEPDGFSVTAGIGIRACKPPFPSALHPLISPTTEGNPESVPCSACRRQKKILQAYPCSAALFKTVRRLSRVSAPAVSDQASDSGSAAGPRGRQPSGRSRKLPEGDGGQGRDRAAHGGLFTRRCRSQKRGRKKTTERTTGDGPERICPLMTITPVLKQKKAPDIQEPFQR